MQQEIPEPAATLPDPQPVLADGVPAADQPIAIPDNLISRIPTAAIARETIRRIGADDKCLQKLMKTLRLLESSNPPSPQEISEQRRKMKKEGEELSLLLSFTRRRKSAVREMKWKIKERLMELRDQEEMKWVQVVRKNLGSRFDK